MTTIQISNALHSELINRKLFDRETYEEVIWDLIDDTKELNDQTKGELEKARNEIRDGKVHTLAQVKKELGL